MFFNSVHLTNDFNKAIKIVAIHHFSDNINLVLSQKSWKRWLNTLLLTLNAEKVSFDQTGYI